VKILVLASRFPFPLEKGDKLRLYHQIRELSCFHEIVLCALHEDNIQDADFQEVKQYCASVYLFKLSKVTIFINILSKILRGGMPFTVSYFFDKKIKNSIEKIIEKEKPDHIFCPLIRMAEYVKNSKIPKTLDYMDAFSLGMKRRASNSLFLIRPFLYYEADLLKKYEHVIYSFFNHQTIISEQDKAYIEGKELAVSPNGVDIQYFTKKINSQETVKYDIVFVGNLGYYPNIEAAKYLVHKILPLLIQHKKDIKILIAGARPTLEVKNLTNENVDIQGWLEDIRAAYSNARIFVAPIFQGSGQQNKILEAMAMQVPCVTTTLVNNAIKATPEIEILLADTEGVFAEQILKLLQNIDIQENIKNNARSFVEKNYSWTNAVKILNDGIERL
jgi:sugar transferase (PEP-CTERM/EpsH1 system associated)